MLNLLINRNKMSANYAVVLFLLNLVLLTNGDKPAASREAKVLKHPASQVVPWGGQFRLDCRFSDPVDKCIWEHNGVEVEVSNFPSHFTNQGDPKRYDCGITVPYATIQHDGNWTCIFNNDKVQSGVLRSETAFIRTKPERGVEISVDGKPIRTDNTIVETTLVAKINVTCSVKRSFAGVQVLWLHSSKPDGRLEQLVEGEPQSNTTEEKIKTDFGSNTTIYVSKISGFVTYWDPTFDTKVSCASIEDQVYTNGFRLRHTRNVTSLKIIPEGYLQPIDRLVVWDSVKLRCVPDGWPLKSFQWVKILGPDDWISLGSEEEHTVKNRWRYDGDYKCYGETMDNRTVHSDTITILTNWDSTTYIEFYYDQLYMLPYLVLAGLLVGVFGILLSGLFVVLYIMKAKKPARYHPRPTIACDYSEKSAIVEHADHDDQKY